MNEETRRALERLHAVWPPLRGDRLREFAGAVERTRGITTEDITTGIDNIIANYRDDLPPNPGDLIAYIRAARRDRENRDWYGYAKWCGCTTGLMPGIPGYTYCPEHNVSTPTIAA